MRRGREYERKVDRETRNFAEGHAQIAAPRGEQYHSALGKLDAELVEGGSASVSIYRYSITNSAWVDTGINITARDFFLASGETWPASTRVKIEWDATTWVVTQASCDPDSGGGGGGSGSGSASPGTIGAGADADMNGQFYPGGLDYGNSFDEYGQEIDFDFILGN